MTYASNSSTDTEKYSVKVILVESIVSQQDTRVCVYVWPRVFYLAHFAQHGWDHAVALCDEVDPVVILNLHFSKFSLHHLAWVGLTQHCMALARHHAATVESVVDVFLQLSISWFEPDVFDHSFEPVKHFLVSQPVERTSQSTHGSRVCLVCVRQCRSDQV